MQRWRRILTDINGMSASAADAARFATTHWSVVLATHADDPARARDALEKLCAVYWYPLYAFLRRRGHQPADAEDLVQGFIAHLLERGFFQAADPDKGRFRSYLLASLNHFVADAADRAGRLKRGAGGPLLSLDAVGAERRYALEPADPCNPEQLFERRWALTLLDTVLQRLETEAAESGRANLFGQIKGVLLGDRGGVPYAELAPQLGLSEAALTMTVHRLRRRYRELVREEIAHTVSRPAEIEEEMRHLFQVLGG
jgi:RNA polymerase sigma-70 factor (ECF subfamily)